MRSFIENLFAGTIVGSLGIFVIAIAIAIGGAIRGFFLWLIYEVVIIGWFNVEGLPDLVWWQYIVIGFILGFILPSGGSSSNS